MHDTVKQMQQLLEDLLAYSRVKGDAQKHEEVDLSTMAADVVADFKEKIKEKNAVVVYKDLGKLNVIRFQFRQLFFNLISNALKFSDPARAPVLTIRSATALGSKLHNPELIADAEYYSLSFADNGVGFDPQYKDRIFEVFQRLHEYEEYKGTGIGLAICKRIVDNHGGIITATGKLDSGSRFDIYIPLTG